MFIILTLLFLVFQANRSMPDATPAASTSSTHMPPPGASSSTPHGPPPGVSSSSGASTPRVMSYFTAGANAGVGRDANEPPLQ